MNAAAAAARTNTACCQLVHSKSAGTRRPATAAPAGTPVCLIEKIIERMRGGEAAARIVELAGLTRPCAVPNSTPQTASSIAYAPEPQARPSPTHSTAA